MIGSFRPGRRPLVLAAAFAALVLAAGALPPVTPAAHAASKAARSEKDEPQKMFEHASKSFRRGYYDEAITELEKLRNTYPFSRYAVEAELKIADALFKKREYGDAADSYRTFAKLHPKHEMVDYAAFRVGLSLFLEAPKAVDRDQASTEKALGEFRSFIQQYPDSKYSDEAAKKIGEGRDRLAAKELYVGNYYLKHHKWTAAHGRLQNTIDRYPDSPSAVEAQYRLAFDLWKLHKNDKAREILEAFVEKHPDTKWSTDARKLLARLSGPKAAAAKAKKAKPAPEPASSPESAPTPAASESNP